MKYTLLELDFRRVNENDEPGKNVFKPKIRLGANTRITQILKSHYPGPGLEILRCLCLLEEE